MTNRETLVAAIAQTLAPKLFEASGDKPDEMGFPIYDTEDEVRDHLARQFDPVGYWTAKAADIAEGLVSAIEAGGVSVDAFDYDASVNALRAMRTDLEPA